MSTDWHKKREHIDFWALKPFPFSGREVGELIKFIIKQFPDMSHDQVIASIRKMKTLHNSIYDLVLDGKQQKKVDSLIEKMDLEAVYVESESIDQN